jgi:hypothetical protein
MIVSSYVIRDYVVTLEYTLTNVDYIRVSSLIDDHIVYAILIIRSIYFGEINP